MAKKKGIAIDVLVEGPGGDLFFRPVEVTKGDVSVLLETKNTVIRENLKKELKLRRATENQ